MGSLEPEFGMDDFAHDICCEHRSADEATKKAVRPCASVYSNQCSPAFYVDREIPGIYVIPLTCYTRCIPVQSEN